MANVEKLEEKDDVEDNVSEMTSILDKKVGHIALGSAVALIGTMVAGISASMVHSLHGNAISDGIKIALGTTTACVAIMLTRDEIHSVGQDYKKVLGNDVEAADEKVEMNYHLGSYAIKSAMASIGPVLMLSSIGEAARIGSIDPLAIGLVGVVISGVAAFSAARDATKVETAFEDAYSKNPMVKSL